MDSHGGGEQGERAPPDQPDVKVSVNRLSGRRVAFAM